MPLKVVNGILLICVVILGFILINQRYKARNNYTNLANLSSEAEALNKEYSRLQIEEGTFSSDLILKDYAEHKLGLVQADKKHTLKISVRAAGNK